MPTINGTDQSDTLTGTDAADELWGFGGDDTLRGGAGDDQLVTGDGSNVAFGGDGNDNINGFLTGTNTWSVWSSTGPLQASGGAGNDFINGSSTADILDGGSGDDVIVANAGVDTVVGASGADRIYAGVGDDSVDGGLGNDILYGEDGNDTLLGKEGDDTIFGGNGDDTLSGGTGNDELRGGSGNDTLNGDDGNDLIITGDGTDIVIGGAGNDNINGHVLDATAGTFVKWSSTGPLELNGGEGDDFIHGSSSADTLIGGPGNDEIHGDAGNDIIQGVEGNNKLFGDAGNDNLTAGSGNDVLYGGAGNDTLDGGTGYNQLFGGDGDDVYILSSRSFYLFDTGGNDSARVTVDYVKVPSVIENVSFANGVKTLPYWLDALLPGDAGHYAALLGSEKRFNYGYPETIPSYDASTDTAASFLAFNEQQIAFSEAALNYVSTVVDINFARTTNFESVNTITFANNLQTSSAGYAFNPNFNFTGNDIYLNKETDGSPSGNLSPSEGAFSTLTLIHEIGHALGLKHPHNSEAQEGLEQPEGPFLSAAEDKIQWTAMSYEETSGPYQGIYSPLDIAALQYLYGPSKTARQGNDTYVISESSPNFIWDGAGVDTIDGSALSQGATIHLAEGHHDFVGQSAAALITSPGQVTVNFGSSIENLIGSRFDDKLYGSDGNNVITPNGGSDQVFGGLGIDKLVVDVQRSDLSILKIPDSQSNFFDFNLSSTSGSSNFGTISIEGIERLELADTKLALDLDGNAGATAKLLGAFLGAAGVQNKDFITIGLDLMDNGLGYEAFMQAALDAVFGPNPSAAFITDFFYKSLTGQPPSPETLNSVVSSIDSGELTRVQFAMQIADDDRNLQNIDFVGLSANGIEYA